MNSAHFHLIFVHLPILFVPLGACILGIGWYRESKVLRQLACGLFLLSALTVIPVYLIGEEAEELVEHAQGVVESDIEAHEEGSQVALWSTIVLGLAAAVLLLKDRTVTSMPAMLGGGVLFLSLFSSVSLGYAGYLGGKIRHPEAYAASSSQGAEGGESKEGHEREGDDD